MSPMETGRRREPLPPIVRPGDEDISLLAAINVLLANRWKIIMLGVTLAAVLVGIGLIRPRQYTAKASFVPQSRAPQTVSGIAAQFGLALPGQKGDESPAFYIELLESRGVLRAAALTEYSAAQSRTGRRGPSTLVDAYQKPGKSVELRTDATIKRLERDVGSSMSNKSGMVTLTARSESPQLSQQIATRLLQLLNQFNLERRRSQAAEERRFAESRVAEVKGQLRAAEDRLQYFLQANRDYANSPSLRFQEQRLSADIDLLRQLYTTLTQAYEQAKIDEVRDTPVITVVELPEVPVRPDSRGLLLRGLGGMVAGMLLGIVLATVRAVTQARSVQRSDEFAAYTALKHETLADLKRPWRPLMRAFRGGHATMPS
jgi:uncharacterized protein involved in exopolysaccharide biosynthesis